jgi:hypothetical protein
MTIIRELHTRLSRLTWREKVQNVGNDHSFAHSIGWPLRGSDGEISGKHGNTLIRTLRKIYGQSFAAGYPETEKLNEVLLKLNETSLSQLRRDHETGHLEHKIANASK